MVRNKKDYYRLGIWMYVLLFFAAILIIFAFFAPFIFTSSAFNTHFDLSNIGGIADTIGGLMTPFIGLSGVIVTGLAFYIQYKANLIQRQLSLDAISESKRQFKEQLRKQERQYKVAQFESHFFEMLRLHKDNVNELEIVVEGNPYKGRAIFKYVMLELHKIIDNLRLASRGNTEMLGNEVVFPYKFHDAYRIFFWGDKSSRIYNHNNIQFSFAITNKIYAYDGSRNAILGHYYRHLYHMVKYVVEDKVVSGYTEKMRYLTILRAQLSNHEQIMLFYNWLAGFGANWEEKDAAITIQNQYFTEYRMIHNLWSKEVYQASYILNAIKELDEKSMELLGKPLLEESE